MKRMNFYKKIVQRFVILLVVMFSSCNMQRSETVNKVNIIPKPVHVELKKGSFVLSNDTKITCSDELIELGNLFVQQTELISALKPVVTTDVIEVNVIVLNLDKTIEEEEGYKLDISKEKIVISGKNKAGILYGAQTLIQLISSGIHSKETIKIPCVAVDDYPRFKWRGMHLDVSRHFFTVDEVKKYIDIIAIHKLNMFHWHLTDDQGWRIEIKKYPKLTEVGAWREDRRREIWNIDDEQRVTYDKTKAYYGGFYTQKEIKDVVQYAQVRNITVVPEIEMPGHSRAALVAYPELSCFGYDTKVASAGYVGENWDFSDPFCAGNDASFEFLENVLEEVIDLFPSEYIHIAGDECSKNRWSQCSKCQARIKTEGLKDELELQSYFIKRVEKYLNSKGRKIIGWQEILEGGMNPSAAIMPWRGESALEICVEAAQVGHEVIMTPSDYLYFNAGWPAGNSISGLNMDLKNTYGYDPIPHGLEEKYQKSIIGLEACLWSEHTLTFKDVEYQVIPRIAALSEIAWTKQENKNWDDFSRRLNDVKAIYNKMDINYYIASPTGPADKTIFTDKAVVKFDSPSADIVIKYTIDGSLPTEKSKEYVSEFVVEETTTVTAASFDQFGQKSKDLTVLFEKQDYRQGKIIENPQSGIKYKTFNKRFRSATLVGGTPVKTGVIETVRIVDKNKSKHAGLILDGYINIPEKAIYTFFLASKDGSILHINDRLIVDNDGFHRGEDKEGNLIFKSEQVALDKGYQSFTIKYFDWGEGEMLRLFMQGSDGKKYEVTKEMLFHN